MVDHQKNKEIDCLLCFVKESELPYVLDTVKLKRAFRFEEFFEIFDHAEGLVLRKSRVIFTSGGFYQGRQ